MRHRTKNKPTRADVNLDIDVITSIKRKDTIGAMLLEAYESRYDQLLGYSSWALFMRDNFRSESPVLLANAATRRAKNEGIRKLNRSIVGYDSAGYGLDSNGKRCQSPQLDFFPS